LNYLEKMKISGRVVRRKIAVGSKSENKNGICLVTKDKEYILIELGANPFSDKTLKSLVGKQVELEGTIEGNRFFIKRGYLTLLLGEKKK